MAYPAPDLTHFFNWQTRTSIELPLGWVEEESGEHFVIYTCPSGAVGVAHEPKLVIKVVTTVAGQPNAYQELARQMTSLPERDTHLIAHHEQMVDGFASVVDVFTYYEALAECRVAQYQAFVQVDAIVFSITGMVEEPQQTQFLPIFETVLQSIRFIPAE